MKQTNITKIESEAGVSTTYEIRGVGLFAGTVVGSVRKLSGGCWQYRNSEHGHWIDSAFTDRNDVIRYQMPLAAKSSSGLKR